MDIFRTQWDRPRSARFIALVAAEILLVGCGTVPRALGPVKVNGSVGTLVRVQGMAEQEAHVSSQVVGRMDASSYVVQKWLARVNGSLEMAHNVAGGGSQSTSALAIGGRAAINLLPMSRIPTSLFYQRKDSRTLNDDVQAGGDRISNDYGFGSSLGLGNGLRFSVNQRWSDVNQDGAGQENRMITTLSSGLGFGRQSIGLAMERHAREFRSEEESDFDDINVKLALNHSYAPTETTRGSNAVTYINRNQSEDGLEEDLTIVQGFGSIGWRPQKYPFSMHGAYRVQSVKEEHRFGLLDDPDKGRERTAANANLALRYPVSKAFTANAALRFNYASELDLDLSSAAAEDPAGAVDPVVPFPPVTDGGSCEDGGRMAMWNTRDTRACFFLPAVPVSDNPVEPGDTADGLPVSADWGSNLSGDLSYRSTSYSLRGFDWKWTAGGALGTAYRNRKDTANSHMSVNVGHDADREVDVPWLGLSKLRLSQALGTGIQTGAGQDDPDIGLSTNLQMNHRRDREDARTFLALSMSARQSTSQGQFRSTELVNLILNRAGSTSPSSGWSSDLLFGFSRDSGDQDGDETRFAATAAGHTGLWIRAPLGIDNLMLRSDLHLRSSRLAESLNERKKYRGLEQEPLEIEWRSRAMYRIGMMNISLRTDVFRKTEKYEYRVQLRILRTISTVL